MNVKLTRNWQIKLIAMFLAVALWLYTSGQARMDRTVTVRVTAEAVKSLPEGYRIVDIVPKEFTVDIDAPMGVLRHIENDQIVPVLQVGAKDLSRGEQEFPITSRTLGLDPDARIQRVHPDTLHDIVVKFDQIIESSFVVEEPDITDVPRGLDVGITLNLTQVPVSGPKNLINELKNEKKAQVRFEPVSLAHVDPKISQNIVEKVILKPILPSKLEVKDQVEVEATITVKPITAFKNTLKVPLTVLAPPDFFKKYDVDMPLEVALPLSGPENKIRELRASDIIGYVNLTRPLEPNVLHEVEVKVVAPAWLTCDPTTVRVTLSLIAAKPVKAPEDGAHEQVPEP
jgi:hypothetical protein